jgi:putative endonuclease
MMKNGKIQSLIKLKQMFFVYILQSYQNDKHYIGSTQNLDRRLKEHNAGKVRSTKALIPYRIIYKEAFPSYTGARKRELDIKKRKSRKYIEALARSVA